ncbi:MAG: ATP-dependent 6-phosphofructokinase [Armatimonadota bacterium]|nr:ATP-dependent 6-phosphofructokinase [Armatimonadota bacterium]
MKSIGILTSGGDCPGMNACIAAIVGCARQEGYKTVGVLKGFHGLIEGNAMELDERCVSGIAGRGGTILGTSRNGSLKAKLTSDNLALMFDRIGIDALIVLGGGGSISGAKAVADAGFPVIAIPCTIDNDIQGTDYTIGFDTACNHVIRAANDITDTAESLEERVFLIETLGGDTGHIALAGAYAISGDAALVPEVKYDLKYICNRIKVEMDAGKPYSMIVVAEGAGPAQDLARLIAELIGRRVRVTVLGHAQRGGSPTYWDRKISRKFGEMAVELLANGETAAMTAMLGSSFVEVPLSVPVGSKKPLDLETYNLVNKLSAESGRV